MEVIANRRPRPDAARGRRLGVAAALGLLMIGALPSDVRAQGRDEARSASADLEQLERRFDQALDELEVAAPDDAASIMDRARRLDGRRRAAIASLPADERERVLGVGGRGRRELSRELRLLRLSAPVYRHDLQTRVEAWPRWAAAELGRASTRSTLFWLMLLAVGAIYTLRRRRRLLESLRHAFVDTADTRASATRRGRAIGVLSLLLSPTVALLTVWLGFEGVRALAFPPELRLLRWILMAWASVALAVAALESLAGNVNRRLLGPEAQKLDDKLRHSLRSAGFFVVAMGTLLHITETIAGRGYLYELVTFAGWLTTGLFAYVLLYRFREETTGAWLSRHPEGGLARALERRGRGLLGFPFLLVANLRLGLGGLLSLGQQLALGFEHTRRGLAFLFRRRLERVAETKGHGAADPSELPAALREAFTGELLDDTEVEGLPELDTVLEAFHTWHTGGRSLDVALVGEQGAGKTAWLAELAKRTAPLPVIEASLTRRLLTEEEVCREVAKILGLDPASDVASLVTAVGEMEEHTVVLLDHAELLMLRCVGGMAGMEAFSEVLRRTSEQLVWVCSFTRAMWDHLRFVMRGTDVFQRTVELNGFSEERIGELVERRLIRCGYEISYEDILPRGVKPRDREAELERVRGRYLRLLWDYSDGMPQVALDYWLRSLVIVGEGQARVRLFAAPKASELERLHEAARFTLHAVMSHESLDVAEAARVLAWPECECLSILELLRSQLVLERNDGRYRVTSRYNRAVVRHLRRKHLLHSHTRSLAL